MKNILLPFLRFFSIVIILVSFPIAFSFIVLMVVTAPLWVGVYWILTGKSLNPVKILENCTDRLEVWTINLLKKFSVEELPF